MSSLSRLLFGLMLASAPLFTGCAATPSNTANGLPRAARHWIDSVGGVTDAPDCQQRADGILERLLAPWEPPGEPVRLAIIDNDRVRAYAWPPCHVLVSRGMMNTLPEDEIAAAIAHELGHLIDDEHMDPPVALVGSGHSHDKEHRADAIGLKLMARSGYTPAAMTRLLQHLIEDPTLATSTRKRIERRLADCK